MSGQTLFGKAYLRTLPDGTTERVEFVGWQPVPVGITRHGESAPRWLSTRWDGWARSSGWPSCWSACWCAYTASPERF